MGGGRGGGGGKGLIQSTAKHSVTEIKIVKSLIFIFYYF
jgi:hypothetical protein